MSDLVSIEFERAALLSRDERRDAIARLEEKLKTFPQIEEELEHYHSERVYAREMRIKADQLIIGKIHKFRSLNILLSGEATVVSVDGVMRIQAPYTFVSQPGAKRVIYAHSDVAWMTIHGTSETDLSKIEKEFIAEDYDEVETPFSEVLKHVSAEELRRISENPDDQVPFDKEYGVAVWVSPIEGNGLFAVKNFKAGETICPARVGGKRTPAGRFSNHGAPNAKMAMRENGDVDLVALKDIYAPQEILTNYLANYNDTRLV